MVDLVNHAVGGHVSADPILHDVPSAIYDKTSRNQSARLWIEQSEGSKFWLRVMNELKTAASRMDGLPAEPAKRGDEHAQHRRQWRNAGPAEHDSDHAANAAAPLQLRIALRAWRPARRRSWERSRRRGPCAMKPCRPRPG